VTSDGSLSNQFVMDKLEDLRRELQKFHARKNNYIADGLPILAVNDDVRARITIRA
jgi:hypothetical protein